MSTTLRTILVPLDGSALAEQAITPAIALARASGAMLHLVHALVSYAPRMDMPGSVEWHEEVERGLEQDARAYLQRVADRVSAELPGQVQADPIRTRPLQSAYGETAAIVQALRRHAQLLHVDLTVIATHARGGVSRVWLGSVADALIRRGTGAVLLVHPRDERTAPAGPFHHILVPLDGSALAEQALPIAQTLASLSDTRLTLLQVIVPQRGIARPAPVTRINQTHLATRQRDADAYLTAVGDRLRAGGTCTTSAIVVAEQPARAILDYIVQHDVDLVAMSTHGHGGVRRFMLGSVADKLVRGSPVPVLLTTAGHDAASETTSAAD